ncbi:MAG TPA: hypothetical protein VJ260_02885, partial [Vicinamibacterales bacterium]|nr:hypothetical protein [Vicinamibacterales bacterium]
MTFLELCQELARKAAISGSIVSVADQTGEALRVVNWIAEAYELVQTRNTDWSFLRTDAIFAVAAPTSVYLAAAAGVDQFGEWRFADGWRCYSTAAGVADEQPVRYCKYDAFRNRYQYGNTRTMTDRPQVVTEGPDQALHFWPIP